VFCLITSLLDTGEYPALDLACCYPDRWGCETVTGPTSVTEATAWPYEPGMVVARPVRDRVGSMLTAILLSLMAALADRSAG